MKTELGRDFIVCWVRQFPLYYHIVCNALHPPPPKKYYLKFQTTLQAFGVRCAVVVGRGCFHLFVNLFADHNMMLSFLRGSFLPPSSTMLLARSSWDWVGFLLPEPLLGHPLWDKRHGHCGAQGQLAAETNQKKYTKFLEGARLNWRVFVQFHGSRVKSDKSSRPPLSTKWSAIQVFIAVLQNYSPHLQRAANSDFPEHITLYSAFLSIP